MNSNDSSRQHPMCWKESVLAHQGLVRWQISRLIRDANVVDDLAQEVFVAWFVASGSESGGPSERPVGSVKAWLLTVARNKAVDWLRKNSRISIASDRTLDIAANAGKDSLNTMERPEESGQNVERRLESLRHCLKLLQPEHREIIDDFYSRGKSSELIGVQIGKGSNSVRMMLTRIRRALAKCIQKHLERPQ